MQPALSNDSGLQQGPAGRWLARYPRAIPMVIFIVIAFMTGLGVLAIEAGEEQHDRNVMREVGQSVASSLERRGNSNTAYLHAGSALFATAADVSMPLFRRFAGELQLDVDRDGNEGIGWAEIVRTSQLAAFERRVRAEQPGEFEVRSENANNEDFLAPITFLKPDTQRNRSMLGLDLYSSPVLHAAMDEAVRTGRPTATGRLELAQGSDESAVGFVIFMPVLESGPGGRRLRGFVFSPFDAEYFLQEAMEMSAHQDIGVRLYDGAVHPSKLLAEHVPATRSGKIVREEIRIGDRLLVIEVESAKSGSLSPLSMATLLFGLAVASLLMLLVRLLTRQVKEDEAALAFLEEQNSIRNSLTRELNHRVKNTLASIVSIISLTRRRTNDLDEFAQGLEGRVRALSATHDLLTQSDWGTTPVRSVIEAELAPYDDADARITVSGPDVELAPNDALSLGLAVHELTTNASKYGALSQPGGQVSVEWERAGEALVVVRWKERGGPRVSETVEPGFGTELIQKIVAHELRQPVEMRFDPQGVSCTLHVPVRVREAFQMRERMSRLSS